MLAKLIVAAAVLLSGSPVIAQSTDEVCNSLTAAATDINRTLPKRMDQITSLVQFRVNCETRIVTYARTLDIAFSELAPGWRERKQREHTELHCNASGLARTAAFTARDTLMDRNLKHVELVTRPKDCK